MIACGGDIDTDAFTAPVDAMRLEIWKALDDTARQRRSLERLTQTHQKDSNVNHCVRRGDMVLKYHNVRSIADHWTVRQSQARIILVSANSDSGNFFIAVTLR